MEETDQKLTLNGLVETALFMEDLPRSCYFYEQVLGLSKVKASNTGCVFRVGNQRYVLIIDRTAAHTRNKTAGGDVLPPCASPQHDGRGPGHIAFGILQDAVDSWRARLAKHDVDLSEIRWESGACSLYFRDPDGHMIELATRGIWEAP